jgi:L-rhamnose isomerase
MLNCKMLYLIDESLSTYQREFIKLLRIKRIEGEILINNPKYSDSLVINIGIDNFRLTFLSKEMVDINSNTANIKDKIVLYEDAIDIMVEKSKVGLESKIKYFEKKLKELNNPYELRRD